MPISLIPTAGRRDPERVAKIVAACKPGKRDKDVAAEVGCSVGLVSAVRRQHGIDCGVGTGHGTPAPRDEHLPCPSEWAGLASSLGLSVVVYDPGGQSADQSWHVSDARTGRCLGSWVPTTGSLRVLGSMFSGVTSPSDALRLFAEKGRL